MLLSVGGGQKNGRLRKGAFSWHSSSCAISGGGLTVTVLLHKIEQPMVGMLMFRIVSLKIHPLSSVLNFTTRTPWGKKNTSFSRRLQDYRILDPTYIDSPVRQHYSTTLL